MHPRIHAQSKPDSIACVIVETGETLTYKELDRRANQLSHVFRDHGLQRGDHLAFIVDNAPGFFEAVWAAHRCGLYYTPISTQLTASEVAYIVLDCGAKVVVTSETAVEAAVAVEIRELTPHVSLHLMEGGDHEGWASLKPVAAHAPTAPISDESAGRDMLYSSGTTGRPKGIVMPLPETELDTTPIPITLLGRRLWDFGDEMVYLSPAPLYHSAPMRFTMAVMQCGGTVVVMKRFDAAGALEAIERFGVTHSQWVPTMFVRLLRLPEEVRRRYDLSSMRVAVHAAAPCPVEVKQRMIDWWGPIVYEYYSSTEGSGLTAITSQEWLEHPGSVGRAVLGEPHILDDDGAELGPNETGTIYFEGGNDFRYHNDQDKSAAARDPLGRGWTTVGDVGYLDDESFLYLTDRRSHMIISGGVNIYPQEAENVLTLHPLISDVAVIGLPDPEMGEQVLAVVQLVDPAQATNETAALLIDYCRSQLAHYKCPRRVDFVTSLPRQASGKMNKRELWGRYQDEEWPRSSPALPAG